MEQTHEKMGQGLSGGIGGSVGDRQANGDRDTGGWVGQ